MSLLNSIKSRNLITAGSVVLLSSILLSGCSLTGTDKKDDGSGTTTTPTPTKTVSPTPSSSVTPSVSPTPTTSDTTGDFSKFSVNKQEINTVHEGEYQIDSVSNTAESGYHRITFVVSAKNSETVPPYVIANYRSDLGSIRLDFNGVKGDTTGIGYQKYQTIDKDGVVKIYHNVSSDNTEELYDIGVSKSTDFYLHNEDLGGNKWNIILDVKYPGNSDVTVNTGNNEFGQGAQSIDGGTSVDSAKIISYAYTNSNGVFTFVWKVSGTESKPIPKVNAEYTPDGKLVVTFPDLLKDGIAATSGSISTSSNAQNISWSRSGKASTYTFTLKSKTNYKLSSSTNPNEVRIEINNK